MSLEFANSTVISTVVCIYRGFKDLLVLKKNLALQWVEGDYVLSANNCPTDEILAALSLMCADNGGEE